MTSRDLSKKYKVGNLFSAFFVAHVLVFSHIQTRFPHSLFKNFSQKIFKRAQTMLQSWLKFTDSFSFHFSKLPRKNFLRKFLHPRLLRSSQWQRNFDNVLYFENNRRSLRSRQKKQSIAPTELKKISTKFFYKPFVPTEQSFQKWNFSKILNKPYPRCDKLGKLGVTKTLRKTLLHYVKQIP